MYSILFLLHPLYMQLTLNQIILRTCLSIGNHVTSNEHATLHVTGADQNTPPVFLTNALVL